MARRGRLSPDAIAGAGCRAGGAAVGRGSGNTRAIYSKVGTRRIPGDFLPYFGDFSGEKIGSEAGEVGC